MCCPGGGTLHVNGFNTGLFFAPVTYNPGLAEEREYACCTEEECVPMEFPSPYLVVPEPAGMLAWGLVFVILLTKLRE
jgi:hypothetical protein